MKDLKIFIGISSFLLIIYLIALYNQPKPINWSETYSKVDKIPNGTYVLRQRLTDIFPGSEILDRRRPVFNNFQEEQINQGSYIIIAGSVNLDEYDYKALVNYMHKGNDVFIATYYLNPYLKDTLKLTINSALDKRPRLKFTNKLLGNQTYSFDRGIGDQYFSKYDTSKATVLGTNGNNKPTFLKYAFGRGALYLIPSPKFFTNYNILTPLGSDYAAKSLSYLKPGGDIIWDEFPALGHQEETSIFRVFFLHPELRYAYYIALFSLMTFVVLGMKRRQRMIPIIEPFNNSTVEFVELVGKVHYQQRNHSNIARKKVTYLLEHIRNTYKIETNVLDEKFKELLIVRSGIEPDLITRLLLSLHIAQSDNSITDKQLISLTQVIEEFYYKSR